MCIFGSVQPKSECIFLFLYDFIFKPYHLSSFPPPLQEEIDICPRGLFCLKFNAEKFLFEPFLRIMPIFGSVQPKIKSLLFFILSKSKRILVSSSFQYLPVERDSFGHIREYLYIVIAFNVLGWLKLISNVWFYLADFSAK